MRIFVLMLTIALPFILCTKTVNAADKDKKFIQLTGWGGGNPEEIVPKAADTGFNEILVWDNNPEYLNKLVQMSKKYDIGIYSTLSLLQIDRWKKRFPQSSPPLQVMDERETAALQRINNDKSVGKSNYQFGGEPFQKIEVLECQLLCFHHPEVLELFKKEIKDILTSVPDIKGIAFDFFGYQNYHCCNCEFSQKLFQEWKKTHSDIAENKALDTFSLETLVEFNNKLSEYARTIKPNVKIATHVYPVFLPEPLYGNRLDVDFCGQTAAWFFEPFWNYQKITDYSKVIFGEEKKYFKRSEGSALIGIYRRPTWCPGKTTERIRKELQAILDGGGDRVQVCSMNDVIENEDIRQVFKEFFGNKKIKSEQPVPVRPNTAGE